MDQQLQIRPTGQTLANFDEMEKAAKWVAESNLFGIKSPAQAMCLFLLCQSEGVNYIEAIRRYHLIDNKPAMRADYMLAKFGSSGCKIIWHIRLDDVCAATLFSDGNKLDDAARKRAKNRFDLMWKLQSLEKDSDDIPELIQQIADLSWDGEETLIRTLEDAEEKGLTTSFKKDDNGQWKEKPKTNWKQSPRQMLTARVITEGVRLVAPGLIAGVYTPDEVEDIATNELQDREHFIAGALEDNRQTKNKAAIQAMIDDYLHEAKTAKPDRKRELLGLVSDLRLKLQEMDEPDEIPGIAPAREVESEILPAKVDGELPLQGESPRVKVPWREYILQHVKPKKILGKALGTLVPEELGVLYDKTKFALEPDSGVDPQIRTEAEYIKEAHDHYLDHEKQMVAHGDGNE